MELLNKLWAWWESVFVYWLAASAGLSVLAWLIRAVVYAASPAPPAVNKEPASPPQHLSEEK